MALFREVSFERHFSEYYRAIFVLKFVLLPI